MASGNATPFFKKLNYVLRKKSPRCGTAIMRRNAPSFETNTNLKGIEMTQNKI